jgi:hypothetical protein
VWVYLPPDVALIHVVVLHFLTYRVASSDGKRLSGVYGAVREGWRKGAK